VNFDNKGDHLYTNFLDLYKKLISRGYYVDVSFHSLECMDLSQYNYLIIIDPEKKFSEKEIIYI